MSLLYAFDNSGEQRWLVLFKVSPKKDRRLLEHKSNLKCVRNSLQGPWQVFCEKSVLKNSAKFTGKHLYQSRFFNKVADLLWYKCFPVNLAKNFRTSFL